LKAVHDLGLIGQVFEGLAIILVAGVGGILTLNIIDAIGAILLPILIFLIVAKMIANFESCDIAKVRVQEGRL